MITLTPAQSHIARNQNRFRVLNCGRRFGKTTLAIQEILGKALSAKFGDKIVYIAPTIQQARDIAWQEMKQELAPIIIKSREAPHLELEVMNKEGESVKIMLRGWEAIETLRGQHFIFLVLDEVASMRNFWVGWNEVLSPTLIDQRGDALFISTPKGFNHFYDLYNMQEKDKDYISFHYSTYDNPNIPVDEIEREKKSKPENAFAQEYLADFRKAEGLVYPEFRRDYHVYTEREENRIVNIIAGVDFGFTNPAAVITIEKDFDGSYWVSHEWYKRGKTDSEVAEYVAARRFNEVYPDPESPSAIEEMKRLGVNVKEVVKNKDSIKNGINKIRGLLMQNKLHVHASCVNLIAEFESYAYPEKRDNRNEDENPIKENDHALDALRYAIFMDDPRDFYEDWKTDYNISTTRNSKNRGYE